MVRVALLAFVPSLLASVALGAPLAKRQVNFPVKDYAAFQISDGQTGNAKAEAAAIFVDPFANVDLATLDDSVAKNMETMRKAAEAAETGQFNPAIDAAGGTKTDAGATLQNGKIKNKVLKLTAETQVLKIKLAKAQAAGDDTASITSKIAAEQKKLDNNIATDTKNAGQASKGVTGGAAAGASTSTDTTSTNGTTTDTTGTNTTTTDTTDTSASASASATTKKTKTTKTKTGKKSKATKAASTAAASTESVSATATADASTATADASTATDVAAASSADASATATSSAAASTATKGTNNAATATSFKLQDYAAFQISDGTAGDAKAQADAIFVDPFDNVDLATLDDQVAKDMETMRKAAEAAETDKFNPAIEAAGGTSSADGAVLQAGKIKNKVLKLTAETQVLKIKLAKAQAAGSDTASITSKIAAEQKKLDTNIATDEKNDGKASKGVA